MTLHGGIFDYDMITSNDFTGMCVVALNSVPGASTAGASSSSQQNHTLPLFVITDDNMSKSLLELGSRLSCYQLLQGQQEDPGEPQEAVQGRQQDLTLLMTF